MTTKILERAQLRELNLKKTRHVRAGEDVTNLIRSVAIAKFESDPGFYLLYFDIHGKELNDTYHETHERARHQAEFEFGLQDVDWVQCPD